jgi:hypothetical protein
MTILARFGRKPSFGRMRRLLRAQAVKTMSTAWWTPLLLLAPALSIAGCQNPRVVVIPADRKIIYLAPGTTTTNATSGYFVPSARMQEILRALAQQTNYVNP